MKTNFLLSVVSVLFSSSLFAQGVTWKVINDSRGSIPFDFKSIVKNNENYLDRNKLYDKASIPAENASWGSEGISVNNGVLNYTSNPIVQGCNANIAFSYFQTEINIPDVSKLAEFKLAINQVDDGARIYLYNTRYPKGTFNASEDIKSVNEKGKVLDFSNRAATGKNRIVIVKFDSCRGNSSNTLSGVNLKYSSR
jgi:hypothetical protein